MPRNAVTRREILNVSATLFAQQGYRSTSLELVADKLGVTRQALYYHFKSKGALLGALFDEVMTKLESGVATAEQIDSEPWFVTLVRSHVDVAVANVDLVALLLHERPEIAALKGVRAAKRRRDYARLFIDAYEQGVALGVLRAMDSWIAVNTVISAANGVSWWYHGETSSAAGSVGDIKETIFRLLADGFVVSDHAVRTPGRRKQTASASEKS